MAETVDEETCPICGRILIADDIESYTLTHWSTETTTNALVQMFCSQEHLTEWLVGELSPSARARLLDDVTRDA